MEDVSWPEAAYVRSSWQAAMEEVDDQLQRKNVVDLKQWKKYLTCCNGRSRWPGVIDRCS